MIEKLGRNATGDSQVDCGSARFLGDFGHAIFPKIGKLPQLSDALGGDAPFRKDNAEELLLRWRSAILSFPAA